MKKLIVLSLMALTSSYPAFAKFACKGMTLPGYSVWISQTVANPDVISVVTSAGQMDYNVVVQGKYWVSSDNDGMYAAFDESTRTLSGKIGNLGEFKNINCD